PGGREDPRAAEPLRRRGQGVAAPLGAQLERELPCLLGSLPDEGEHAPALVEGDLADDVRGAAEPVQAEAFAVARQPERPESDQPRAEERGGLEVRIVLGDREHEALVGDGELRVAAVDVVSREPRARAAVLAAGPAITGG